jgi:tripartite-type tricarboxylate transporter receptor subunit TctC
MTAMMRGDGRSISRRSTPVLRAIASLASKRMPELPDVPTFRESGFDFSHSPWYGIMASGRLPRPLVNKINKDVLDIIQSAKFREKLQAQFLIGLDDTPEQFDEIIRNDTAALSDVFKDH